MCRGPIFLSTPRDAPAILSRSSSAKRAANAALT
jgi:hypothetical protein